MRINLANLLTLFRIAAIPIVVVCFYSTLPDARPIAAFLFGIAAVTDLVDGWVARRFGQTSRFGEFLDPVADKLMVAVVLVMLVETDQGWWVDIIAMIIIGREITISALREWMAIIGERANVKVAWSGKIKTALQMFGIGFMVYEHKLYGLDIYRIGFVHAARGRRHDRLVDDRLPAGRVAVHHGESGPLASRNSLTARVHGLESPPSALSAVSPAGIAQLVERNLAKVEVASSSLVSRSKFPRKTGG